MTHGRTSAATSRSAAAASTATAATTTAAAAAPRIVDDKKHCKRDCDHKNDEAFHDLALHAKDDSEEASAPTRDGATCKGRI
jgi:hypothetical protein